MEREGEKGRDREEGRDIEREEEALLCELV